MVVEVADETIDAANAAALSGKLLQLASGAIYNNQKETIQVHARKLDALEDLIEAANGNPILIAYWFHHDLDRIQARIKNTKTLTTDADIRA